jgi:simple sugar transport system ATP-binding protein
MAEPLLEARGIVKSFGKVRALRGADFTVNAGEVVALIGDNGAGKSTLVKTLSGVHPPDAGVIIFEGKPVTFHTPEDAHALGIETVYQDLALAPDLESAANLFLGREVLRPGVLGKLGFLDNGAMRKRTKEAFGTLGVGVQDVEAAVATFSGGVARAVTWASKVVFMDEPTAALGVVQTRKVLELIRRVRDHGLAVVLISHNMTDVLAVSDRVEVLRLGERVAQYKTSETTIESLVGAMTGALSREVA